MTNQINQTDRMDLTPLTVLEPATTKYLKKKVSGSLLVVRHKPTGKELIVLFDTRQLPVPGDKYACAIIGEIGWCHVSPSDCEPLRRTSSYKNATFQASKIPPV